MLVRDGIAFQESRRAFLSIPETHFRRLRVKTGST